MTFSGLPFWAVGTLLAASAGALAVLHLLRVRPREVRVVTTLFWDRAVERTRARTLLHRFRHPRTYALLLLLCALLVLALGQPERTGDPGRRTFEVIVLDAGASMAAPETAHGGSRFDAAREAVVAETQRLSSRDRVALIVANPWPRLVHAFDEPRPWLRLRLADLGPDARPAVRGEAVKLARSLLRGRPNGKITLVTDRPLDAALPPSEADADALTVLRVGAPVSNAAILSAMFVPRRDNPLRGRFDVRVGHWGELPEDVSIFVQREGGAPLLRASAVIAPGQTHDFSVDDLPADGDRLVIELSKRDAIDSDNRATYRVPLRPPIRVRIEGAVPSVLQLAIASDPATRVVGDDVERDVTVRTDGETGGATGPCVLIVPSGPEAPAGRPIQPIRPAAASPLAIRPGFDGARCGTGAGLGAAYARGDVLLEADGVALASLTVHEGSPCLALGPALLADDSDAPKHAAFAVLISRGLRRLAGWDSDPVVLTPERALADLRAAVNNDTDAAVAAMPGSRQSSDLSAPGTTEEETRVPARWGAPALFETILLLALACFVAEAVLHTRGRIS